MYAHIAEITSEQRLHKRASGGFQRAPRRVEHFVYYRRRAVTRSGAKRRASEFFFSLRPAMSAACRGIFASALPPQDCSRGLNTGDWAYGGGYSLHNHLTVASPTDFRSPARAAIWFSQRKSRCGRLPHLFTVSLARLPYTDSAICCPNCAGVF
jgi:hypothetical protein